MRSTGDQVGAAGLLNGRYRIVASIGRGGMGEVWRARDELLHRDVAIKQVVIPFGLAEEDRAELRLRFVREARNAARLHHPAVITVHDVFLDLDEPRIVMEYVPSRSLAEMIENEGPASPVRAARIGLAVAQALRAAHAAGVLHRDVKPGNVLIGEDGRVVLTDFGVARFEGDPQLTMTGHVLGSPGYIAPELGAGQGATAASDLWSLGATLYAAVEGRAPYSRENLFAMLVASATEDPDPMRRAGPLAPVITALMEADPARRIGAEAAERMLAEVAAGTDRSPVAPVLGPRYQSRPARGRRRPGLVAAAAAIALGAAGAGAYAVASVGNRGPTASTAASAAASSPPGGVARLKASEVYTFTDVSGHFTADVPKTWHFLDGVSTTSREFDLRNGLANPKIEWARIKDPASSSADRLRQYQREALQQVKANERPAGFKLIRLDGWRTKGGPAAEFQYLHQVPSGASPQTFRVVDRLVVLHGSSRLYHLHWRVPENQWPALQAGWRTFADSLEFSP